MTKVINFIAGPGAGKSTLSLQLTGYLKNKRYNAEYVSEYAKDLVWGKHFDKLDDQIALLGEQHHRLYHLLNQVDYIVTDSPLVLSLYYIKDSLKKFKNEIRESVLWPLENLIISLHYSYDSINFFVNRKNRKFIQSGRNEDKEKSKEIDSKLLKILDNYNISYKIVSNIDEVVKELNV